MKRTRRGVTLVEMLFVMVLSGMILAVGYRMYAQTLRMQDVEAARESAMLTVQNAMGRLKTDIRAASSVQVSGGRLLIESDTGQISYYNLPGGGIARARGGGRVEYRDISATFADAKAPARGVNITLKSATQVHRRPIRIEISSFMSPRN